MNTNGYIIAILSIATLFCVSCSPTKNENTNKHKEEKHADEIIFTQKQAASADMKLETITPGDFMNVVKVGGQIQSTLGDEQTVAATASGIVSFTNTSITD